MSNISCHFIRHWHVSEKYRYPYRRGQCKKRIHPAQLIMAHRRLRRKFLNSNFSHKHTPDFRLPENHAVNSQTAALISHMAFNIGFGIFLIPHLQFPRRGEIAAVCEILDVGFHSHPVFQVARMRLLIAHLQNRQKRALRDFHIAHLFHAFFTGFLFFQQFFLTRNIAAVAFR